MKVLVTGSSGFIGRRLTSVLLAAGHHVRAAGRIRSEATGSEFKHLDDIRHADWPALLEGMDAVVHLAGIAHTRGVDAKVLDDVNHHAAVRLVRQARPGQQIVFMSSIRAQAGPASCEILDESATPRPECAYGRAKLAAEREILAIRPDACVLRPVTVYGDGVKFGLRVLAGLADTPFPLPIAGFNAERSFLAVENLCSAVIFALIERLSGTFIVSDPDTASLREIVSWVREGKGRPGRTFSLPDGVLFPIVRALGLGGFASIASTPLVAPPRKLVAFGWSPVYSSTSAGVFAWARPRTESQGRS